MASQYKGSKVGFPIRKSSDQSSFAAPQGLSQRTTSFIASQRLGIHRMLLRHLIALMINVRNSSSKGASSGWNGSPAEEEADDQKDRSFWILQSKRPCLPNISGVKNGLCAAPARACKKTVAGQPLPKGAGNRTCSLFTISNIRATPHLTGRARSLRQDMQKPKSQKAVGGARRDRTDDLKLAKLALSQLSYGPSAEGRDLGIGLASARCRLAPSGKARKAERPPAPMRGKPKRADARAGA